MTRIVQINEHDNFRVLKSDSGDWFYTKLEMKEGSYDLEVQNVQGRWWVSKAEPVKPTDHKQLMKEFRKRVKENNNG